MKPCTPLSAVLLLVLLCTPVPVFAQDRPAWGPTLRTAHLRTPDGTLVELQSY